MKIVIIGCGKMGNMLAERLVQEKHDVIIIDRNEQVLENCLDTLDVLTVKGSGVNMETLQEADIKHADIVIATTVSDETNMLCCLTAKRLGAKYSIARIRDPEYLTGVNYLSKELSINLAVNPERMTAREISRMLRLPFAMSVDSFARGRVEMVEFRAESSDPFVGIPLADLYRRYKHMPRVLVGIVERDSQPLIPGGDFIIREGDSVYVLADSVTTTAFFKELGKNTRAANNTMIIGGSRIAYYLATLLNDSGLHSTIIEYKAEKSRWLSDALPFATIIHGDGTDQQFLRSEGLNNYDAFVALTDRDEDNLMTGLYAMHSSSCKVIVKNNRGNYSSLMRDMGMECIISPLEIACNIILRAVRTRANVGGTAIERVYSLMNGRAEALEFIAHPDAPYIGIPLKDLHIRQNALIAVIVREGEVRVPFGNDTIEGEDHVVVITRDTGIIDLGDIMEQQS